MHDAARFGHVTCVEQLLAGGSDANTKNHAGQTASDVAAANGKTISALGGTSQSSGSGKCPWVAGHGAGVKELGMKLEALRALSDGGFLTQEALTARQVALCEKHGL